MTNFVDHRPEEIIFNLSHCVITLPTWKAFITLLSLILLLLNLQLQLRIYKQALLKKKMRKAFSLLPSSSQFSKATLKLGVKFVKQDYNLPELTSPECARLQMIIKKFAFKERKKPMNLLAIRASFRYNVSNITFSTENLVLIIPSFQLFD